MAYDIQQSRERIRQSASKAATHRKNSREC